ncbi:hypothetical protein Hypma_012065 [Hypsizygus marmoreus]|uniref:Uncharacterized protein n=1 Tax=Hypsizygus marmoreus TaxID=39966 RepID=A0A369JKE9_HYPMA|nr:hypothetical protein Hypma_012065 [Hypsizygus marmoreus]
MNACLLLIIAWLISATILRDVFTPLETPVLIAFYVTQDLIIAWALYSILATTTIPFLLGECRLRMRCGFRPTEVVFRRPPMLDKGLSQAECVEQYRRFVARSMDPYLIYASVSSFMTNELWVSAYPAIMDAYDLIDRGEVNEGSLESAIWLQKDGTWSVCELCKIENMV